MLTKVQSHDNRDIPAGTLIYRCNICGEFCKTHINSLTREAPTCQGCGSSVRMRTIIDLLSTILFGDHLALYDFPVRPDMRIIGLSDWEGYAIPLKNKANYTNTFYHKEPKLDIMSIDTDLEKTVDILISSDVFEHIPPPASTAFENSFKLLKPNGFLIITVPFTLEMATHEHYPELHDYEIMYTMDGRHILKNTTKDGRKQTFKDLFFHGGEGFTLEMRAFCKDQLIFEIEKAGFVNIRFINSPCWEYGIYWSESCNWPLVAMRPG